MTDILDKLDAAAAALLNEIEATDKVSGATLADRVKVFDAVVEWAKIRKTLAPEDGEKQETKLDAIRNRFHGQGASGRGNRASKAQTGSGQPAGIVNSLSNGSDAATPSAGGALFDA